MSPLWLIDTLSPCPASASVDDVEGWAATGIATASPELSAAARTANGAKNTLFIFFSLRSHVGGAPGYAICMNCVLKLPSRAHNFYLLGGLVKVIFGGGYITWMGGKAYC